MAKKFEGKWERDGKKLNFWKYGGKDNFGRLGMGTNAFLAKKCF